MDRVISGSRRSGYLEAIDAKLTSAAIHSINANLDGLWNRIALTQTGSRAQSVSTVLNVFCMALFLLGAQNEQPALAEDLVNQTSVTKQLDDKSRAIDKNAIEWIRGKGKDLEMCLKGEVFDKDGKPANGINVTGQLNSSMGKPQLKSVIDGHRFEIWIPANESPWYSMQLTARSTQDDAVAYLMISASDLRQAIVGGVKLTLKQPTRHVKVKVVDKGQPVSGATVAAELGYGVEIRSQTNELGVADFRIVADRQLSRLVAWTGDFRIGGYSFDRSPVRDPSLAEHVVELSACREQRIRFVNQDGAPIPGVEFQLQIATAPPNYNFIGTNEHSVMTTDASGEVIDKWFPDWDRHYFYPELRTNQWVIDGDSNESHKIVDGVALIKLKKSRIADRRRVTGQVKSNRSRVGGFHVTLDSFQGEQMRHRDVLGTFTDADGTFLVNVLPDATYCTYVLDGRWVSDIIDLIPYESATGNFNLPLLRISEGQEVEVIVTSGPNERPYPDLHVSFSRQHSFQFRGEGKMQQGTSGPQWWTTTDEAGRAVTQTLPGELRVHVYTPLWRTEEKVIVNAGEPVKIHLHREVDEKQSVTGRLVLPDGMQISLKETQIKAGSLDGTSRDEKSLTAAADGRFQFEIVASQLGIFAMTNDKKAAGALVVKDLDAPIQLQLLPTIDFQGKLVNENGDAVAGKKIQAVARFEGKKNDVGAIFANVVDVLQVEAMTDEDGNYTLKSLPVGMRIMVWTSAADDPSRHTYFEDICLKPNESRPREVHRLKGSPK